MIPSRHGYDTLKSLNGMDIIPSPRNIFQEKREGFS